MPGRCYHDALLHHFNQTPQVSSIIIPLEYLSYSMTRVLPSSGVFSAATKTVVYCVVLLKSLIFT